MRARIPLGRRRSSVRRVKQACQAHTGITEGTFYRDQGWYFYLIGKYMERADQTTRLLDVKYHALLPSSDDGRLAAGCQPVERAAALGGGLSRISADPPARHESQQCRRLHAVQRALPAFADLLRARGERTDDGTASRYRLRGGIEAMERLDELRAALESMTIDDVIGRGTHEFLDFVQTQLIGVTDSMRTAFFGDQG